MAQTQIVNSPWLGLVCSSWRNEPNFLARRNWKGENDTLLSVHAAADQSLYRVAGAWQAAAAVSAPLPFATEENLSKVCNVDGPWSGGGIGQAAAFAVVLVCRHENNWKARTTRTTTTVQGCRSRGRGACCPNILADHSRFWHIS